MGRFPYMKRLLVLAALAVIVTTAPAHAGVIPNTGATLAATDPNWSVLWRAVGFGGDSHGAAARAFLVTSPPTPPWQPPILGVNNWLGANANATIGSTGDGSRRYEYAFSTKISLPGPQTVTGAIGYDNYFLGGFINGNLDMLN